jgi:lysophospholipase L1-like esterase
MQKFADNVTSAKTGRAIDKATVVVTKNDGSPAQIYSDNGTTLRSSTLTTDANGYFEFYAPDGHYRITVSGPGIATLVRSDILLEDPADGSAALAAASGASLIGFQQAGSGSVKRTLQDKAGELISLGDKGGDPAASDNLTAVNALITDAAQGNKVIDLNGKNYTLSAKPTNTYGVRFRNGKLLVPSGISTYLTAANSYADDLGIMVGREHLSVFWRSVTAGTQQTVYVFGDSTVEMDAGYPLKSHELLERALWSKGVNDVLTVNRGVSGSSWSDLNAVPDLGASTKLILIKYGINDADKANPLATMAADARAKLTAIRAAANGNYANLSILLMGPNATFRPSHNQDAKWYEDVRNVYLALAREFGCAYFDTYAYMQDATRAPGLWLDNIGGSGEGLHPDPVHAYRIWWEAFTDHILGDGQANTKKSNQFWNLTNYTKPAYPTDGPQTFAMGITIQAALTGNGFPFDGILITTRHAEFFATQEVRTLDAVPRRAVRTGSSISNVWTQWTGVPIMLTYLNSWSDKAGGYASAGYVVGDDGFVELFGVVKGGSSGVAMTNLPSNARPVYAHAFASTNGATVTVYGNGDVIASGSDVSLVGLDGVRFKVL